MQPFTFPDVLASTKAIALEVVLSLCKIRATQKTLLTCSTWPARSVIARDFTTGGEREAEVFKVPIMPSQERRGSGLFDEVSLNKSK